jgi:DNA-binding MarR family transcriptional regulator
MAQITAACAGHGLSPSELDVLVTLRRSAAPWVLTPSEIQRALLITSGGLTKILQQLEGRGLVTRLTLLCPLK